MLLIRLSLRNLLRQKRRNMLLGSAMAIGVAILVTANSFSHGISDIMFNRVMRYVTGHVAIRFNERGGVMSEIFRDKARMLAAVKDEPLIEKMDEGGIAVFKPRIMPSEKEAGTAAYFYAGVPPYKFAKRIYRVASMEYLQWLRAGRTRGQGYNMSFAGNVIWSL